jgi:hypothetical protein
MESVDIFLFLFAEECRDIPQTNKAAIKYYGPGISIAWVNQLESLQQGLGSTPRA